MTTLAILLGFWTAFNILYFAQRTFDAYRPNAKEKFWRSGEVS